MRFQCVVLMFLELCLTGGNNEESDMNILIALIEGLVTGTGIVIAIFVWIYILDKVQ